MTPLERLREQVEAATPGPWARVIDGLITLDPAEVGMERVLIADLRYFTIPHVEENVALIISSTRLARALCDPGTVTMVARAVTGVDIWGQVPVTASEIDTAQAILNALAGMGVGE